MPTTTTQGLWFPDDTAPVAPLEALFSQQASSFDIALTGTQLGGWPSVASATARNTLFPTPTDGDRVWRDSLNYGEIYYGSAYTTTPGWYPAPGTDLGGLFVRPSTDSWSATTRTNILGYAVTVPAGRYSFDATAYLSAPISAGNLYLSANGADVNTPPCDQGGAGIRDSHSVKGRFNHTGGTLTGALAVLYTSAGSKSVYIGSTLEIRYVGPPQ